MGKIPFISSYAMFSPGRNWEQIRTTICYNEVNVKICGAHAGVSVGPDGATHQAIEDIAIMRPIANMSVFAPCDALEAEKITYAISKTDGPCYVRYAREKTAVFTTDKTPFEIGKAQVFWDAPKEVRPRRVAGRTSSKLDAAIIACGPLVHNAILAAGELEREGIKIRVLNLASIKPMDEEAVVMAARDSGAVVTVEEHQVAGGMGSAVAEVIARRHPVPLEFVGVQNRFGESGAPGELIERFGMGAAHIKEVVQKVIARK
ncbi:MAG: transketolase, partial [Parcubacteria group bacterium Greene0714_36]